MKLLTKEIELTIPALYSTEGIPEEEKMIVCKFFALGNGWSWYVTEGERQGNDYLFYGLVEGFEREWGYFTLRELQSIGWHGIPGIERDLYFKPVKVGECGELSPKPFRSHSIANIKINSETE